MEDYPQDALFLILSAPPIRRSMTVPVIIESNGEIRDEGRKNVLVTRDYFDNNLLIPTAELKSFLNMSFGEEIVSVALESTIVHEDTIVIPYEIGLGRLESGYCVLRFCFDENDDSDGFALNGIVRNLGDGTYVVCCNEESGLTLIGTLTADSNNFALSKAIVATLKSLIPEYPTPTRVSVAMVPENDRLLSDRTFPCEGVTKTLGKSNVRFCSKNEGTFMTGWFNVQFESDQNKILVYGDFRKVGSVLRLLIGIVDETHKSITLADWLYQEFREMIEKSIIVSFVFVDENEGEENSKVLN